LINYDTLTGYLGEPWQYKINDCWAVFTRASRELFNINIEEIKIPESENLAKNIAIFNCGIQSGKWTRRVAPEPGDAVLFRNVRGHVIHIGLYVEKAQVLHCRGSEAIPGSTTYENLKDILKIFKSCEFYRYENNSH